MEGLGLNLGYLLVQIFNFAIIFVVLRAWVFKPILGLLDRRRTSIAQGREATERAEFSLSCENAGVTGSNPVRPTLLHVM